MEGIGFGITSVLGTAGKFASGLMASDARQAEFAEQLRQLERKKTYTLSLTKALSAASGVATDSNSTTEYLKSMTSEFNKSIGFLNGQASDSRAADMFGLQSTFLGGSADAMGGIGRLNNWKF